MGNIKESYPLADRGMFGEDASPRILNRHHPATKIGHLRVER
jgi:hypothetical protein